MMLSLARDQTSEDFLSHCTTSPHGHLLTSVTLPSARLSLAFAGTRRQCPGSPQEFEGNRICPLMPDLRWPKGEQNACSQGMYPAGLAQAPAAPGEEVGALGAPGYIC